MVAEVAKSSQDLLSSQKLREYNAIGERSMQNERTEKMATKESVVAFSHLQVSSLVPNAIKLTPG